MGGAAALILGILGLFTAFIMGENNNTKAKKIDRLYAIDRAIHYYNQELQFNLRFCCENEWLELLSGMKRNDIVNELFEKHGNSGHLYDIAELIMIKKIMQNLGYDYENEYDTPLKRECLGVNSLPEDHLFYDI